jgi:hypothetical protein
VPIWLNVVPIETRSNTFNGELHTRIITIFMGLMILVGQIIDQQCANRVWICDNFQTLHYPIQNVWKLICDYYLSQR